MKSFYRNNLQDNNLEHLSGRAAPVSRSVVDAAMTDRVGEPAIPATLKAMAQRAVPAVVPKRQVAVVAMPVDDEDGELKLPATWYQATKLPAAAAEGLSPERHALLIRVVAATCLALAFGLVAWLGAGGVWSRQAQPGIVLARDFRGDDR